MFNLFKCSGVEQLNIEHRWSKGVKGRTMDEALEDRMDRIEDTLARLRAQVEEARRRVVARPSLAEPD